MRLLLLHHITIDTYGLMNVNASIAWAPIVVVIDRNIHITFLPVLSITYPNTGLATAPII